MAAEVKWVKITTDIFDDEKIKLIDAMPDSDAILVIWFKLLAQAGKANQGGALLLNHKLAYTEEMLATIFCRKITTIRLALDTFERLEMIERGEYIQVINWDKHQNVDALDKIRENNKLRVQKYREKKVLENTEQPCNVTVTLPKRYGNALESSNSSFLSNSSSSNSLYVYVERFNLFWKFYPKKVGKGKCEEWFKRNKPSQELTSMMIKAIEEQKSSPQWLKDDGQFIPNPFTWLNQKRWGDDLNGLVNEREGGVIDDDEQWKDWNS